MNDKYVVVKSKKEKTTQFDFRKIKGFKFEPKENIKMRGIDVKEMLVINPSFVEKILKKKIKIRLDLYLQFIIGLLDDDSDADPGALDIALNDLTRYKSIIKNNYRVYLDNLYYELLLKKIEVIENELKMKAMYARNMYYNNVEEETKGKGR